MADSKLSLFFTDAAQTRKQLELDDRPVTIGRDPSSGIVFEDERVTRRHCEIRLWNGDFVIKDLHSKNGTHLNGKPIEVAILNTGDMIKVGPFIIQVHDDVTLSLGETQAGEVLKEMDQGKGFRTIMHGIVDRIEDGPKSDD